MKKFLVIVAILIICIFGYNYFIFEKGLYTNIFNKGEAEVLFTSDNKEIKYNGNEFIIKGVTLNPNIPSSNTRQYSATKDDYLRWLNQIHGMGANTINLREVLDSDFYNALYEFNSNNESPLYIIQGISLTDYINNNSKDAYDKSYTKMLSERSIAAVDIIHGRKNIILNRGYGFGVYRKDVSKWLIGYVIGGDWNSYTIAYTNDKEIGGFKGKYFETTENASAFESLLAKQMDEVINYETEKYNHQSLISISNNKYTDPFEYDEYYARQLSKINSLDIENIKATESLKSGYFAAYNLEDDVEKSYYEYFSDNEKKELELKIGSDESIKSNYLSLLNNYHTMPIVITGYGYSTSRGIESNNAGGPLTEEEQGELLVSKYKDIISSGCAGGVIESWLDNWNAISWNTSYSVDINNLSNWNDVQTERQGYGLISFEIKDSIINLDGDKSEWSSEDLISTNNNLKLFMKSDAEYVYFMIDGIDKEENLIIPIDITPKSGSLNYDDKYMKFDRNVDFIIDIKGEEDSKILVQDYYNSLRENYLNNIKGIDPFVDIPEKYSSDFNIMQTILEKDRVLDKDSIKYDIDGVPIREVIYNEVYDTGKLTYGNSNPESNNYNSLSDFYYGYNFIEIRIPWQLLNFYNPSRRQIHDDYYENYGVEPITIKSIYAGVGLPNESVSLEEYKLKSWKKVDTTERLKKSYEIIKEYWGGI